MSARLVLSLPPSVNNWLRVGKTGKIYKTAVAKEWAMEAVLLAQNWRQRTGWTPTHQQKIVADYWIWWPDLKSRDPSNLEKVLWDALEGIVYDNDRWVLPRCQDFAVNWQRPRVELEFWVKDY